MRVYSQVDEENVRAQALVREWGRAGLLDGSQVLPLEAELHVNLRRTNPFFRIVLFLFTLLIVTATVSLIFVLLHLDGKLSEAAVCFVGAAMCLRIAEILVRRFHLYRFGVEEVFAVGFIVLLSLAVALIAPARALAIQSLDFELIAALAIGAVGSFAVYLRFGYLYAAVASMMCAAAIAFPLDLPGEYRRLVAALICAFVFAVVRSKREAARYRACASRRLKYDDDFPGDDYSIIQTCAWAGLYLALNLQISWYSNYQQGLFYWSTYAMTWILPVVGLWLAIPVKDRLLMDVSLAAGLVTLATNKPYLHMTRQPWDPILFGILLAGSAVIIKRWLSSGANGQRNGFTAARLLVSDRRILTVVGAAAAAFQPNAGPAGPSHQAIPAPGPADSKPDFGGGRSGGGGASGGF